MGAPAAAPELPEVLASIGGEDIAIEDLPSGTVEQLARLDQEYLRQRHEFVKQAVQQAVHERLIAAEADRRGISVSELVEAEIGTIPPVTGAEVEAWYDENLSRLEGRSLDDLRDDIRNLLRTQRAQEAGEAFERRLRAERDVTVYLPPFRVNLDNEGAPALGPEDAVVTLVEFSDFECPFCGRFYPTLKRIAGTYGDRVRIVYRQFPLTSIHPSAFKAAQASLCAHEQGAFWAYHDLLFEEQDQLAVRDLKQKAGRIGLDQEEFDACLDTGRAVEQVQADMAAGRAAGVEATPALFVNGILIPGGAVDYEVVAAVIDEELRRAAM